MFPGNQSYEEGPKQFVLVLLKKYEKKYPENCTFRNITNYWFFCKNTLLFCTFWCIILIDRFVQKSTHFETNLNVDK